MPCDYRDSDVVEEAKRRRGSNDIAKNAECVLV